MSSATSPYQSRLLSWLNRQSIRFRDRFAKTRRRLKVTASWSIQILLYPIYLTVQTGRITARGLGQKVKSSILLKLFPLPQADQPLQNVFDSIQPWLNVPPLTVNLKINQTGIDNITNRGNSGLARLPQLRGVACWIETKHLVLVDCQNQIWDVLSQRQQQQLTKRISNELVKYWQKQRRVYQSQQPWLKPLPLISVNPHIVVPIIWFWQLMAWIQTKEVALAINLFGESYWLCPVDYVPVPLPSDEEDIKLVFASEEIVTPTNLVDLDRRRRLAESADDYSLIDEYAQSNNSIQSLIKAAVDYFFGAKNTRSGYDSNSTISNQIGRSDRLPQFNQKSNRTKNLAGQIKNRRSAKPSRRQLTKSYNPNLLSTSIPYQTNKQKSRFKTRPNSPSLQPKTNRSNLESYANPLPSQTINTTKTPNDLQLQSKIDSKTAFNQIETSATPQGYHQNWLQTIIAWLDHLFFKIEKIIITMWHKLTR